MGSDLTLGDIKKFLLSIVKTNMRDMLPMCQDKLGHVD